MYLYLRSKENKICAKYPTVIKNPDKIKPIIEKLNIFYKTLRSSNKVKLVISNEIPGKYCISDDDDIACDDLDKLCSCDCYDFNYLSEIEKEISNCVKKYPHKIEGGQFTIIDDNFISSELAKEELIKSLYTELQRIITEQE